MHKVCADYKNRKTPEEAEQQNHDKENTSQAARASHSSGANSYLARIYLPSKFGTDGDELEEYLAEEPEGMHTDILAYWKKKRYQYPHVALIARDWLAATASNASSERANSNGERMIGSTRYSLSPQMMQVTACLKSWKTSGALIAGFEAMKNASGTASQSSSLASTSSSHSAGSVAGSAAGTSRSSAQPQPSRSAANEKRSNSSQINIDFK